MSQANTSPPQRVTPELLGQWLDRFGPALVLFARQFCESAEDVVQEVFISLAREPAAPRSPAAWLFRCTRNRALSAVRAKRRRQQHEAAAAEERGTWFEPPPPGTASDAAVATEALADLPETQRQIVVARLWGGLTFAELAEMLQTSTSVIHRSYTEALETLRHRLDAPCPKQTPNPTRHPADP